MTVTIEPAFFDARHTARLPQVVHQLSEGEECGLNAEGKFEDLLISATNTDTEVARGEMSQIYGYRSIKSLLCSSFSRNILAMFKSAPN